MPDNEPMGYWDSLDKGIDLENEYREQRAAGQVESEENPEIQAQAVEPVEPVEGEEKDEFSDVGDVVRGVAETALQPVLGVADFASDLVGIVPWLKPIDQWWDDNSYRSTHPGHQLLRDASSVILPSLAGGWGLVGKAASATKAMSIPSYARTLGSVAAYTGVDTAVAMVSSHSKTEDNMAATLNNWLGWNIPWATRAGDSPDVRWKKNVFESAGMAGGVELLGAAFSVGRRTKLIPRDEASQAAVAARQADIAKYEDPLTASVEPSRVAREAAQDDEMMQAIKADPEGKEYNAFVNDLGPDDAGRAVINTEPDPLMAKVHHTQIQNNIDSTNGRAAAVVDETFNRNFLHATDGDSRARQLDQLFDKVSPTFDAVVNGKTIKGEQMNRAVDNLANAVFGTDISLKEFEFIMDDMKSTVFNSNAFLDEEQWTVASKAFNNVYKNIFDPNQRRASALLTQQAADNITDTATAVLQLGEKADVTRQMNIIFDKMNLLGQEVEINNYIVKKAKEYQLIKGSGDADAAVKWINQQGGQFDDYVRNIKHTSGKLNAELKEIAKNNPQYYRAFVEAYDATNGSVDELHKLKRLAESNIGLIKKGFIDGNPSLPSMLVKQINAARINGMLAGMAPVKAVVGNSMLTAIKPVSVFAGAYMQGKPEVMKRALYTFGGVSENFKRGLKVMKREWDLARLHPEEAMMRGRADLKQAQLDKLDYMDSMADGWRQAKEPGWQGKVALWNMTKAVSWWNKQHFVRWGTNALYAIDGMTNSFMASGMARARAYDELFSATRGAIDNVEFQKLQRQFYNESFDESGKLTNEAAKFASQEIALNLNNEVVKRFDDFLDAVPAARGLFLFPRTGVNAAALAWSFNPLSSLGIALPKFKNVMKAATKPEKLAALAEHGIDLSSGQNWEIAFSTLKSEYIGRQIMGSSVVMGCGLWALEGNMTGNGPQDGAERARMMKMGWQPLSIKNPITGEWRSYQGFEPFASVMGLTADIVYQGSRMDQAVTEDFFRKAVFSISMNITNNTFVGGFEPLAGMLTGDPTGWNRFWANQTDQLIPMKGMRSILNNIVSPQLRDVNNDFLSYLANGSKFLVPGSEEGMLPDLLDVYTGKPIKYQEPITAAANAILPYFKQNSSQEPWRQWLLSTGWDGLQKIRKNKFTGEALSSQDRYFINNWIAQNAGLKHQIIQLMSHNDGYFQKEMRKYAKLRGLRSQADMPVKEFFVHRELDKIHDRAFDGAWNALEAYNEQYSSRGRVRNMIKHQLRTGDTGGAIETQKLIYQLKNMRK